MKLFIINDRDIKNILDSLTVEDTVRNIIESIILRFDYNFTNFIYSVFSVYTTYYAQLTDENSHLNYNEAQNIFNTLTDFNISVDRSNVFVADIFDIMYITSAYDRTRFKSYFYEDTYNRLENLLGVDNATTHMEEIFEALETIFSAVEENLVFKIIEADNPNPNVIFYLELTPHGLMVYVV
ncbi:MAG: aminoacyl-histidine dipeptidase [Erysipelotrichaceae bacterium]|nr:aminoacyl-histidine dipeptidase [Erysipelotrichaceae bacterium]